MQKNILLLFLFMFVFSLQAQEVALPSDLRQHNLTSSNSSFLNPAFSVNYENTQSIGLWSRWQWQTVDADPTTFFINYTGKLDNSSSIGAGFYQHNTSVFLNTGGVLNYAYRYRINERSSLSFGLNLFGFQQEFTGNPFQNDPQLTLPQLGTSNDFIVQLAPGIQFTYDRLSIGFASENLLDYNFNEKAMNSAFGDKIYLGSASYDFPINILVSDASSVLRPMVYFKSIPGFDTQIGVNGFLSTNKFWAQTGYNSFYGVSIGGGGRFMQRLSVGALVEFGMNPDLKGKDPTFELVTAYDFGNVIPRRKMAELEEDEEEKVGVEELSKAEALFLAKEAEDLTEVQHEKTMDSLAQIEKDLAIAVSSRKDQVRKADSLQRVKQQQALKLEQIIKQKRLDSLAAIERAEALAVAERKESQRKVDSISKATIAAENAMKEQARLEAIAKQNEPAKPQEGEKYEEVVGEDGLTPGYYLIANVFGTKKYFDAFMADLTKKGLQPKSFFRSKNKYNYVYLQRFDTMNEAREARDSKFKNRYADKTWIYRVRAK